MACSSAFDTGHAKRDYQGMTAIAENSLNKDDEATGVRESKSKNSPLSRQNLQGMGWRRR